MKSKFQNFDFGTVEVLSREESAKVKGGAYGSGQYGNGGGFPPAWVEGPGEQRFCVKGNERFPIGLTNSCPDGWNIR